MHGHESNNNTVKIDDVIFLSVYRVISSALSWNVSVGCSSLIDATNLLQLKKLSTKP